MHTIKYISLACAFTAILINPVYGQSNRGHGSRYEHEPIPPRYHPASKVLVKNIRQVEDEGRTTVGRSDTCERGLLGYYRPSANKIVLCLNNLENNGEIFQTLIHEAVHRAQHCKNYELGIIKDPESLRRAIDALPIRQARIIHSNYDGSYEKILEVEARLWEEYAGGTDNFYGQWFLFSLSKACGGPMAKGYVDMSHWDYCLGGRTPHDDRGNPCPYYRQ